MPKQRGYSVTGNGLASHNSRRRSVGVAVEEFDAAWLSKKEKKAGKRRGEEELVPAPVLLAGAAAAAAWLGRRDLQALALAAPVSEMPSQVSSQELELELEREGWGRRLGWSRFKHTHSLTRGMVLRYSARKLVSFTLVSSTSDLVRACRR